MLGDDTPEKLVNTLLYLIGIYFTLHACDEHKALKVGAYSQLKIKVDPETNIRYLEYNEHYAKNHQGGIKSLYHKNKIVKAFENTENPDRCIVHIFEKYMSKHPSMDPKYSFDLYLRPLVKITSPNVWYSCQAIGVQTLQKVIAKLAHNAGLPGRHTNHSLRATTATRLYEQNVDEHRISKLTGHHSVAVRNYQRVLVQKEQEQSDVLYGKNKWNVKRKPTATVSSPDMANFNIGSLTQLEETMGKKAKVEHHAVQKPIVHVQVLIIRMDEKPIVVQPVINLNTKDLK